MPWFVALLLLVVPILEIYVIIQIGQVIGGTLLHTPGFVTDIFGFFFVLPFTRPLARRGLSAFLGRRFATQLGGANLTGFIPGAGPGPGPGPGPGYGPGPGPGPARPGAPASDDVVQGEVIDPDPK